MDLKELLGEELYNQMIEKLGDHKVAVVNDGNWFPKSKFDEVNEAKKQFEKDLIDRDKQLADLKKNVGDNEELKKQIQQLQDDNKAAKEKYEEEAKELRKNTALKLALAGQVHDEEYAISQLDKSKLEFNEDGTIKSGLEDQIKALRESKAFLFIPKEEPKPPSFKGSTPAESKQNDDQPDFANMTDEQYYKYLESKKTN